MPDTPLCSQANSGLDATIAVWIQRLKQILSDRDKHMQTLLWTITDTCEYTSSYVLTDTPNTNNVFVTNSIWNFFGNFGKVGGVWGVLSKFGGFPTPKIERIQILWQILWCQRIHTNTNIFVFGLTPNTNISRIHGFSKYSNTNTRIYSHLLQALL